MNNNYSNITAPYGRFYAGMTLREAQANGTDKSFWRRDFHNLDKNNDGVLSVNEIMRERKRESRIEKLTALGFGAMGIWDMVSAKKFGAWELLWAGIDAFIVITSAQRAHRIDKENGQIEQQLAHSQRTSKNNFSIRA